MAKTIPVELSEPITLFDKPIKAIEVVEPTGSQFLDHGEPQLTARTADGAFYMVEDREAIRSYVKACITIDGKHEHAGALVSLLGLGDMKKIKSAVLSFF
jgi:hypothetical protein